MTIVSENCSESCPAAPPPPEPHPNLEALSGYEYAWGNFAKTRKGFDKTLLQKKYPELHDLQRPVNSFNMNIDIFGDFSI